MLRRHRPTRYPLSRRRFLQGAAGGIVGATVPSLAGRLPAALAAVSCPSDNPIVSENRCTDPETWSPGWNFRCAAQQPDFVGFATTASINRGEAISFKASTSDGGFVSRTDVRLQIWRLGYYAGRGARLIHQQSNLTVTFKDTAAPNAFGTYTCANFDVMATIPGGTTASWPSGVYLAKMSSAVPSVRDWHMVFVVRDDDRARDLLVVMPTNSWQAYNYYGAMGFTSGKSLYYFNSNNQPAAGVYDDGLGRIRASKLSFDRPHVNPFNSFLDWVLNTEFPLIYWLEQMGYDLAYTEDVALTSAPAAQLRKPTTKTIVIAGHSEYWTKGMRDNVQAARDAGTNVASFSANTAYWQVRYEDAGRTLVCFKSIEGTGATGTGNKAFNDFGPGNAGPGSPDSALGPLGTAINGQNQPELATTTFRDPGIDHLATGADDDMPTSDGAPPNGANNIGRVGINRPENELFGILYLGDDDTKPHGLTIPAGANGEFAAHPDWRNCNIPASGTSIGASLLGWEWDGIPSAGSPVYAAAAAVQPARVKRMSQTDPRINPSGSLTYLLDAGRKRSFGVAAQPPAGQQPYASAVTYRHASGAYVFASGTMQWSWGLAPRFNAYAPTLMNKYQDLPVSDADPRIQQATYNILSTGGVQPDTPTENIVLDPGPAPPPEPPIPVPPAPPSPPAPTPPGPDRTPPRIVVRTGQVTVASDGVARIRITLDRTEARGALGKISLETQRTYRLARTRRRRRLAIGSRTYQILSGRSLTVDVKLTAIGRRLLRDARSRTLPIYVQVQAQDLAGNARTIRVKRTLRRPASRRATSGQRARRSTT